MEQSISSLAIHCQPIGAAELCVHVPLEELLRLIVSPPPAPAECDIFQIVDSLGIQYSINEARIGNSEITSDTKFIPMNSSLKGSSLFIRMAAKFVCLSCARQRACACFMKRWRFLLQRLCKAPHIILVNIYSNSCQP